MRYKIYFSLLMFMSMLLSVNVFAQDNGTSESVMRSNGKIYVVVAICVTILIGLLLYIISIDRKIGKIEKENL